jgi:hypothetical protein
MGIESIGQFVVADVDFPMHAFENDHLGGEGTDNVHQSAKRVEQTL